MTDEYEPGAPILAEARAYYAAYLDGTPLADCATMILDHVGATGGEAFGMGEAIEATNGADLKVVLPTLMHLCQGKEPPLVMEVLFVDGDERYVVDNGSVAMAQGGTFRHPRTGEAVEAADTKMHLEFRPVPGLLREHDAGPTP